MKYKNVGGCIESMIGKPTKHKKEGRRCKFPNCTTILSQYNLDRDFCFKHISKYYDLTKIEQKKIIKNRR